LFFAVVDLRIVASFEISTGRGDAGRSRRNNMSTPTMTSCSSSGSPARAPTCRPARPPR
jgi:hypothetical protein